MRLYLSFLNILLAGFLFAQTDHDAHFKKFGFELDSIADETGLDVEYLSAISTEEDAGLILYCTGSLPVPIFIEEDGEYWATIPSPVRNLTKTYDFAVLSKPGLGIVEPKSVLDDRFRAVAADGRFRQAYLDRNYLEYYVTATRALLDQLLESKNYSQVVLMGHSQGARVAAKVAATHPKVTHLVYLSGNPLGRYDQLIREKREANLLGQLSDEEAQEEIEQLYARWRHLHTDPENLETGRGDSNKTWISFSASTMDELLGIDIPIFVGYGTRDIVARYCDLLPLHFISAGKDNLHLKAYPGYDHSFYRKLQDGRVDFEDYAFPKVIDDMKKWLRN